MLFDDVDCPHKDVCSGYPVQCDYCENNKRSKKSYFKPRIPPYTWGKQGNFPNSEFS